jgi:hypothetical protein
MLRLRLWLLVLLVTLITSGVVATLTAAQWVPHLVRTFLQQHAIELTSLEISQLQWHHITLKNVRIEHAQGSANAPHLEIECRWMELIRGQVQRLHLPELTLHINPMKADNPSLQTPKPQTTKSTPKDFTTWLPLLSKLPFDALFIDDLQLKLPTQHLQGSVEFSEQQLSVTLNDTATQLQLAALIDVHHQIQLVLNRQQQSLLTIQSPLSAHSQLTAQTLQADFIGQVEPLLQLADELRLFSLPVKLSGTINGKINIDPQNLPLTTSDWQFDGQLPIPDSWPRYGLTTLTLQAQGQINKQQISAKLQAQEPTQLVNVSGQLQHQFKNSHGELKLQLVLPTFAESLVFLPKVLPKFGYPLDFSGGQLDIHSTVTWQPQRYNAQHQIIAKNLQGFYQRVLFNDLNTHMNIQHSSQTLLTMTAPIVQIGSIDTGILIKDLTFALQANREQMIFKQIKAQLFGGSLHNPQIIYDIATGSSVFDLQLQQLQLGELLALQKHIQGNGVLEGTLPVRIRNRTMSIQGGHLQSRAPGGQIQLITDAATQKNLTHPDLRLAMQLLENFQFTSLNSQLDYGSIGDLKMQTQFSGHNPQWQQGRAVNFNLTLNENIPALLQTLQLSQNLSEKLEQRIKALYKQP